MSGFDINTVTVSGNLTREPELRNLPNSDQSVCSLRIAHNDRYKNASGEWADRPQYFDVTVWAGLGEWIAKNVTKGQKVVVSGRLKWREWGEEGNKRQAVDISADSVIPVPRSNAPTSDAESGFTPPAGDDDIPF